MAAGLAVGFWKDLNELTAIWRSANHWVPIMDANKSNFMVRIRRINTVY